MTQTWLAGLLPLVLTVMVFSRIFGDNPVVRFVQYLFVGMSLGLAVVVTMQYAVRPALEQIAAAPAFQLQFWLVAVTATAALLLPLRRLRNGLPRTLAALPVALLIGTSAAVMVIGLIRGTIVPQLAAATAVPALSASALFGVFTGLLVLVAVLWSLRYPAGVTAARPLERTVTQFGQGVLLVTYGIILAAAVTGYLAALQDRVQFVVEWVRRLGGG